MHRLAVKDLMLRADFSDAREKKKGLFVVSMFACACMPSVEFVYARLCLFHSIKKAAAGHAK